MHGERAPTNSEAASPYEGMLSPELIDRFFATRGNHEVGRELGVRLLRRLGFPADHDPTAEPLMGRSGEQLELDGKAVMWADYVNYAAFDHFDAIGDLFDALTDDSDGQAFKRAQAAMQGWLPPSMR